MIDIEKIERRLEDKLRELTARAEEIDDDLSDLVRPISSQPSCKGQHGQLP